MTVGQFHVRQRDRKEFWEMKSVALERRQSTNKTEKCPLECGNTDTECRKINSKYYNIPWFSKKDTELALPLEPLQATEPHLYQNLHQKLKYRTP
jgi:hypothetical protein